MRMTLLMLLGVAMLAFGSSAEAGTSTGIVKQLFVVTPNAAIFIIGDPSNHSGKPACSTIGDDWAVSLTTDDGRAMYALLLTAFTTMRSVEIYGGNACSAWPDREVPVGIKMDN